MKRKMALYIATSLDGYIAGPDDDLNWLSSVQSPGEDYGYGAFIKNVDTVIIGRKTYEKVLSFGIDFPHRERKCFVISRTRTGTDGLVTFYGGELRKLIQRLQNEKGGTIFCDGGAEVIFELIKEDLIDQYIISVIPVFLGKGTPLFIRDRPFQYLQFEKVLSFPSGLVQLWYHRKR